MVNHGRMSLPDGTDPDVFESAKAAGAQGRPDIMLQALGASLFLDGLARMLQKRWGKRLPETEIQDCVAEAVDAAYSTIRAGRPIHNLGAWLWKAADRKVHDRWYLDFRYRHGQAEDMMERPDGAADHEGRAAADALADHRRSEAVKFARQLLPRLGQGQIVNVMGLLIDAVDQGIPDLPASSIAEALGISADSARKLLSRGLERLTREAAGEGIEFPEAITAAANESIETDED